MSHEINPPSLFIPKNRTGIKDEELSLQHAKNVAFNMLTEWAVEEGVIDRLLHSPTPDAFWREAFQPDHPNKAFTRSSMLANESRSTERR